MSSHPLAAPPRATFLSALATQMRVIGALLMRELHTRYGRDNIGYLWMIGEPLMLAAVIASLHSSGHTAYGSDIHPLPFAVVGYCVFIIFRGIVNRSEGALEANAALLYHRMVTPFDIVLSRVVLEGAGVFMAFFVLMTLLISIGRADVPARPLILLAAIGYMLWISFGHSLIIIAISHDNRTIGRLVHPYTYFMIPASGAFYQVEWIPEPYRSWLVWLPLPHIFELARYGQFRSANLRYVDVQYLTAICLVMTYVGLIALRKVRKRVHLQ